MAKRSYKIPSTLADDYLHMEIALQTKDGVGIKPLPARVLIIWLFALMVWFFFTFSEHSVLPEGGIIAQIIFTVTWFGLIYVVTLTDKSHRMRIELVPTILSYIPKSARHVLTRRTSNAGPFLGIVGIKDIDDSGVVTHIDGTYSYWYNVVGTASVLLFPEDRDAILDRVDDFYKKMQTDCEIIFMTTKQPQKIVHQAAHLITQYRALEFKDPDIDLLVNEQYKVLTEFVGKEFRSIQQYMIIKGDNREALSAINNIVVNECNNSALMLKQCVALYRDDISEVLRTVYAEGEV